MIPRRWKMRALFVGLAALIVFVHLLPLGDGTGHVPMPDLVVALIFAWSVRRPRYVPALLIAAVMFLIDLLLMRPPGLMAALVVIGSSMVKSRTRGLSEVNFPVEWLNVAGILVVITMLNRTILSLTLVPQASLWPFLLQTGLTIAIYPLVVLFSQAALNVRKPKRDDEVSV